MRKIIGKIYSITFIICIILLFSSNIIATADEVPSYIGDSKGSTYRERLIDYADIFSYDVNKRTKDTIVYVRKINDYWYGIFGTANFDLSFGNFKSLVDPKNDKNIFNTIIDFYSQFGTGYTFGLVGEWIRPTSDISFGLKLGVFDRKMSHIGAEDVKVENYFEGDYEFKFKFNAKLTYLTLNPYVKYSFPQFDGFFVTGGVDVSFSYSSLAYLERAFKNTGDIYHKMDIANIEGKTRFLINLGIGYDFFIADFFAANNRVRVTPFADFKGGTNIITSHGSNWNDVAVNIGLQIKLAPDIVVVDTLRYDPNSEIPIDYAADIREENGIEFPGFKDLTVPPAFDLAVVQLAESIPEPEDITDVEIKVGGGVDIHTQPEPTVVSPAMNMTIGTENNLVEFATSASTTLTAQQKGQLDQYVTYLKEHPNTTVRIDGHSDNAGSSQQQMDRSEARASAAMSYLMSKGISRNRIFARGRAGLYPVATNTTEAGRRKNRRVSITLQTATR